MTHETIRIPAEQLDLFSAWLALAGYKSKPFTSRWEALRMHGLKGKVIVYANSKNASLKTSDHGVKAYRKWRRELNAQVAQQAAGVDPWWKGKGDVPGLRPIVAGSQEEKQMDASIGAQEEAYRKLHEEMLAQTYPPLPGVSRTPIWQTILIAFLFGVGVGFMLNGLLMEAL